MPMTATVAQQKDKKFTGRSNGGGRRGRRPRGLKAFGGSLYGSKTGLLWYMRPDTGAR